MAAERYTVIPLDDGLNNFDLAQRNAATTWTVIGITPGASVTITNGSNGQPITAQLNQKWVSPDPCGETEGVLLNAPAQAGATITMYISFLSSSGRRQPGAGLEQTA